MYNSVGSNPAIDVCVFHGNTAGTGAAMSNYNASQPAVTDSNFVDNTADLAGGAIANQFDSSATLQNCTFTRNVGGTQGGALFNNGSDPTITGCVFAGNTVVGSGSGGAIFNYAGQFDRYELHLLREQRFDRGRYLQQFQQRFDLDQLDSLEQRKRRRSHRDRPGCRHRQRARNRILLHPGPYGHTRR